MSKLFARLLWFLGGRPMKDEGESFYDYVGGQSVHRYRDTRGRPWLATGSWSLFRVPRD